MIKLLSKYPIARFFIELRRLPKVFQVTVIGVLSAILYWGLIASDRYVSETHVVVDKTDLFSSQDMTDFASLITGSHSSYDLMLLRDHLLSVDMLQKLDARLDLRGHYSDKKRDIVSRMWSRDASQEFFYRHFLSRISIELDNISGVLVIQAQAYTPGMAHSIALSVIEEGEGFMNEMAHRLAQEQVEFLEKQVFLLGERLIKARSTVLDYQNDMGLLSPQASAESISAIVARLDGQIADLKARRETMRGYLNPGSPDIFQLNLQVDALEKQLREESSRMASSDGLTLNRTLEQFQRLQWEAEFSYDLYHSALMALEKGRIDTIRTIKKVSVVQSPIYPQYAMQPRRWYNITVFTLCAFVLAGIWQMLAAIIRDHKD